MVTKPGVAMFNDYWKVSLRKYLPHVLAFVRAPKHHVPYFLGMFDFVNNKFGPKKLNEHFGEFLQHSDDMLYVDTVLPLAMQKYIEETGYTWTTTDKAVSIIRRMAHELRERRDKRDSCSNRKSGDHEGKISTDNGGSDGH